MYLPTDYLTAILFMFITMLCWGSWANTQKLASRWRFELFYWDYAAGVLLTSVLLAFTLGSTGEAGLSFLPDFSQASTAAKWSAFFGGVVFNIANLLLVAAIAIAGMAVAFPVGIGIALVLGTILSYWVSPQGQATLLVLGVAFILAAILFDAKAYSRAVSGSGKNMRKGIMVSIISGLLMGTFYPLVARSMEGAGSMGPYAAMVCFSAGLFVCNLPFNRLLMSRPIEGEPVSMGDYFKGGVREHSIGLLGGFIWAMGMGLNLIASQKAGPAIAYAFGQGATLVAAVWGVFVWREFKGVQGITPLLAFMFACYVIGLGCIGVATL